VDLFPNALSFRVVTSIDVDAIEDIPERFTGRVRVLHDSVVTEIAWFASGQLHDPARLVAAHVRYRPNGAVKWERFYGRGRLRDPAPDRPAVRGYYATGTRNYEEHFVDGERHDTPSGVAAITKWRPDGSIRRRLYFDRGQLVRTERVGRAPRSWLSAAETGHSPAPSALVGSSS
jgi:hypothetical protein